MNVAQNYTPEQYFMSLANNDEAKYKELVSFGKEFITNTLPKFTYIYGFGSNGKSLLLSLLKLLASSNDTLVIHDEYLDDQNIGLYVKSKSNIVFVSNQQQSILPPGSTRIIHIDTMFSANPNGDNKHYANPNLSDELYNNKELYYDFIMNH